MRGKTTSPTFPYDAELEYIVDIIAVVLGRERFGRFAEFLDEDAYGRFSEFVSKKDSKLRPEVYTDNSNYTKGKM